MDSARSNGLSSPSWLVFSEKAKMWKIQLAEFSLFRIVKLSWSLNCRKCVYCSSWVGGGWVTCGNKTEMSIWFAMAPNRIDFRQGRLHSAHPPYTPYSLCPPHPLCPPYPPYPLSPPTIAGKSKDKTWFWFWPILNCFIKSSTFVHFARPQISPRDYTQLSNLFLV